MSTTSFSRRRFLRTTAGLTLSPLPLLAKGDFRPELKAEDPTPWIPKLKAPRFLGPLGEHLFQPGTLTVVADGSFVGPMDFGMNMVNEVAINSQLPTVVFDYSERNQVRLETNLTAIQTGIDYGRIYFGRLGDTTCLTNHEWAAVRAAEKLSASAPLGFFFRNSRYGCEGPYPEVLLDEGFVTVFEKSGRVPPALIVIDNLEFSFSGGTQAYYPSLGRFLISLKQSAEFYGAAVIVGVGRSMMGPREDRAKDGYRPRLSDIIDAETILPHADAVLLIHHDQYFTATGRRGVVDIIVAENRNGPTGTVEVAFAEKIGKLSTL